MPRESASAVVVMACGYHAWVLGSSSFQQKAATELGRLRYTSAIFVS